MKKKKNALKLLVTFGAGAILTLALLFYINSLNIPIAAFALGFFLVGAAAPSLAENWFENGKTIYLPVAFVAAGVAGFYAIFQANTINFLTNVNWCFAQPCITGLVILHQHLIRPFQ